MTAATPIQPEVIALPRKVEGAPNLVGMTREAMRVALIDAGTPEKQAKMRVGQLWKWIYISGLTDFDGITNLSSRLR